MLHRRDEQNKDNLIPLLCVSPVSWQFRSLAAQQKKSSGSTKKSNKRLMWSFGSSWNRLIGLEGSSEEGAARQLPHPTLRADGDADPVVREVDWEEAQFDLSDGRTIGTN
jgi:hypothetical protein